MKSKLILSLALVVKNEEAMLERCLESVKGVVDEIVVTDTGSTDKTVQIASKYTSKVHYFEWIDDFSAAYNYCISKTSGDYVLKWDADFVLSSESRPLLVALKEHNFEKANHIFLRLQNIESDTGKASGTTVNHTFTNLGLGSYRWRVSAIETDAQGNCIGYPNADPPINLSFNSASQPNGIGLITVSSNSRLASTGDDRKPQLLAAVLSLVAGFGILAGLLWSRLLKSK